VNTSSYPKNPTQSFKSSIDIKTIFGFSLLFLVERLHEKINSDEKKKYD